MSHTKPTYLYQINFLHVTISLVFKQTFQLLWCHAQRQVTNIHCAWAVGSELWNVIRSSANKNVSSRRETQPIQSPTPSPTNTYTTLASIIAVITAEPAVKRLSHLGHRFEETVFMYQVFVLAILLYFWLILPTARHCTAYGCSNRSNKVGWENLSWHKHRFCYMARAGTTEHLNMLFGKICVWRYVSPYYLLEFTTFAVDHDPNASLSCAFTRKPLNCRLNCNNC